MATSEGHGGFKYSTRVYRHAFEALAWPLLRNPVTWTLIALIVSVIGLYIDLL